MHDLKKEIQHIFVEDKDYSNFYITLLSFGFKYGIPADADLVFDVRFLPNPYYVDELKHQTGNDKPVYDYVMKSEDAGIFLKQLYDMLVFLIPRYIAEGKNQLVYRRQASIGDNNQCFVRENERSGIQYQSRTQGCRQRWTA